MKIRLYVAVAVLVLLPAPAAAMGAVTTAAASVRAMTAQWR